MRKVASLLAGAVVAVALHGCSTMRGGAPRHPGIQDPNPSAVNRVYPASATRVAWAMTQVMSKDSILDDVKLMVDPQSNDSRPMSHEERQKLGMSAANLAARDVNYDIQARSKDGRRVGAVVALKGESEAEVSLLYGVGGDPELSKAILDEVATAIDGPLKRPELWKASDAKASAKKAPDR